MERISESEAMRNRHSVRSYTDRPIDGEVREAMEAELKACSEEGGLTMRLVTGSGNVTGALLKLMGAKFSNPDNFILISGKDDGTLNEKTGYYGQRAALFAQSIGLNTCWVAMFSKGKVSEYVPEGEKAVCILVVGYGANQWVPHKSKPKSSFYDKSGDVPQWFSDGVDAAMLAPTAMNQQKFTFSLKDGKVAGKANGGKLAEVDLGIAKYNFEVGAGKENVVWL